MGRELEYKFRLTQAQAAAIGADYGPFAETRMETAYYDTPDRRLSAARQTLRRRLENGVSVITLKTPLPDGSRGEYETESGDIVSAIPALLEQGAPAELEELSREGLEEVCGARFTRLARIIDVPGGQVELALDRGEFTGGGRTLPFTEAEAELKAGPDEVLARFGRALAEEFSLREEPRSKIQRAMALAKR